MKSRTREYVENLVVLLLLVLFFAFVMFFNEPAKGQSVYPTPRAPLGQPSTPKQVALGEELFNETGLSIDGTVSCATCHQPKRGFTDGLVKAVGVGNRVGSIKTPTIEGVCYKLLMFNDGRTDTLEDQVLQPLVNPSEMANQSVNQVLNRLRNTPYYVAKFNAAYANGITRFTLAHAVASYECMLVSFDAPIDLYMAGDEEAITEGAKRGMELFALHSCEQCHPYPLMTDNQFHNNGAGFRMQRGNRPRGRNGVLPRNQQREDLEGAIATPTLRNVTRRAPFMSSGFFPTLESVLEGYNQGMEIVPPGVEQASNVAFPSDRFIDPRIHRMNLSNQDRADFMEFFFSLESGSYPYSGMDRN